MEQRTLAMSLAALGAPVRLDLYRRLAVAGPPGLSPTALAEMVGLQRNLVSYHLRPLLAAGLVGAERSGKDNVYTVDAAALARLAVALHGLASPDA